MIALSKKDLKEITYDIYRDLFDEAKPSADFDELVESGKLKKDSDYPDDYFKLYYLDGDRQEEILQKHLDKHGLELNDARKVRHEVVLGCSPTASKQAWKEAQETIEVLDNDQEAELCS